jgi:hypothetical protein
MAVSLIAKTGSQFADASNITVPANSNAGGDSVHMVMIPGMTAGAASDKVPERLIHGLAASRELETDIERFTEIALNGRAV